MAERYAKLAAGFHSHPKAIAAGLYGQAVFMWALCRNADNDYDGKIKRGFFGPNYLSRVLPLTADQASEGLSACVSAGLLTIGDQFVTIVGWDDNEWGIPNSTPRVRAHRERKRALGNAETGRNVSDLPCNAETPSRADQSRTELAEQKKEILSPDRPATARGPEAGLVRKATASVIGAFNRAFARNLSPDGWEESVRRVLAKGFTEAQLRAVVWWAAREWAEDPEMRDKVNPKTLLKLTSSQGYRTFREYLSCAGERWRDEHGGEAPPWEQKQAQARLEAVG